MTPAGRPEVGKPINVRLGDDLLARVDAYAEVEGIKRAEAVRQLVRSGLRKKGKPRGAVSDGAEAKGDRRR